MAEIKETNGHSAINVQNGVNGHKAEKANNPVKGKNTSGGPLGKSSKPKKPSKIANLMALRKASKRPLPTEMGDGQYRAVNRRPTLRDDLSAIGMNGKPSSRKQGTSTADMFYRGQNIVGHHQRQAEGRDAAG